MGMEAKRALKFLSATPANGLPALPALFGPLRLVCGAVGGNVGQNLARSARTDFFLGRRWWVTKDVDFCVGEWVEEAETSSFCHA
jgi:hypothetical protein